MGDMTKSCSYRGCGRPASGHGLCQAHNWQRRQGQELRPIAERQAYRGSVERDAVGRKQCARCREWLAVSAFGADASKADGLVQWCRPCAAKYKTEWRYGLERGQLDVMLAAQSDACAICSAPFAGGRYYVDHDHQCCPGKRSCGKCVRGLLCNRCNIVAGYLDQNDDARHFFEYITAFRAQLKGS